MAIAVALVVGGPLIVRARPVDAPDLAAGELLSLVRSAADDGYSGTIELNGSLQLPVASRFTDIGDLFGGHTTLRVWWRDRDDWRVDKQLPAGETDLLHHGRWTTQWSYERRQFVRSVDPEVRLPRTEDLLPPTLARRVLEDVEEADVSALPPRRVAGTAAPGLRVGRIDPRSSVGRVDLWADPASGTVLRIDVYAVGDDSASFSAKFTDYSGRTPAGSTTEFRPPHDADVTIDDVLDIADAANQYAPFSPPGTAAGLPRARRPQGAVGVYGSGLTRILVIPLRHRDWHTLRDQIRVSPGAAETEVGVALQAGPLGVLVANAGERSWLVTGTVTQDTLVDAALDVSAGGRFR